MVVLRRFTRENDVDFYEYTCLPAKNSLVWRLLWGRHYLNAQKKHADKNIINFYRKNVTIVYSNAEGFILSNKAKWLPKFEDNKEIVIQHGFMEESETHPLLRVLLRSFSYILGFKIIGNGFGGVKADYSIVYSENEKKIFMNKGWSPSRIITCGRLLKECTEINLRLPKEECCVFFAQLLPSTMISPQKLDEITRDILECLKERFDKVVLRLHPKMEMSDYHMTETILNNNIILSKNDLQYDILNSVCCFSFFSTALLDAWLMGRSVHAIKLPGVPDSCYNMFSNVTTIDNLREYIWGLRNFEREGIYSSRFDIDTDPVDSFNLLIK